MVVRKAEQFGLVTLPRLGACQGWEAPVPGPLNFTSRPSVHSVFAHMAFMRFLVHVRTLVAAQGCTARAERVT